MEDHQILIFVTGCDCAFSMQLPWVSNMQDNQILGVPYTSGHDGCLSAWMFEKLTVEPKSVVKTKPKLQCKPCFTSVHVSILEISTSVIMLM